MKTWFIIPKNNYSYKYIHKVFNNNSIKVKLKDIKYICNQLKRGNFVKAQKVADRINIKLISTLKGIYLEHKYIEHKMVSYDKLGIYVKI